MSPRLVLSPATLAIAVAFLWLGVGCMSDADRAVSHIERAESLLAEGRRSEAVLELRSAIATDPKNADANARMATIMLENGSTMDALFFYREANRLDPGNTDTAVNLAILLRSEDAGRAALLLEDAIRRDPNNPLVYVGIAELQL